MFVRSGTSTPLRPSQPKALLNCIFGLAFLGSDIRGVKFHKHILTANEKLTVLIGQIQIYCNL